MKKRLSLLLFFIIFSIAPGFSAPLPIIISDDRGNVSAGDFMETLEDPTGHLTFSEILSAPLKNSFVPVRGSIPNYGFTDSTYWSRFTVKNESRSDSSWVLEIAFPLLDDVEIYAETRKNNKISWQRYRQGREHNFAERLVYHRNILYPVQIPPGETRRFFMKVRTGDGMIFPATFWKEETLARHLQHEQYFFGIYYGIIIVMILYNLFIFASVRDRNYLYYVLYIAAFGLFQMAMNGLAFQYLWPGMPWWGIHANPVLIGLSVLLATNFSIKFLESAKYAPRLDKVLKILMGFSGALTVAAFFISYRLSITIGQLLPLAAVFLIIPAAIISYKKGNQAARYYLLAWSTFLFGIILSTLRVLGLIPHHFVTEYGLQIGSGLEMVLLSFALADRINIINRDMKEAQEKVIEAQQLMVDNLQQSKTEIEEANRKISLSEEKYRLLVEGSSDIIFSLNEDFSFINASDAIHRVLKIKPDTIENLNFIDLIYEEDAENHVGKRIVKKKLRDFSKNKEPLTFRARFCSESCIEPKEMNVQLEYLRIEGKNEILGKLSNIVEDSLLNFFQEEKQKYAITNYLANAEEITHRITRNMKKALNPQEITFLRIALREIIINSIEHGNLGITFEEKSRAIEEDNYFSFINERQLDPALKRKKVHIEYSLDEKRVVYIITDEGNGFNHRRMLSSSVEETNNEMLAHGRGIAMARNVFDRVSYNQKGNQVMLIKYFSRDSSTIEEKILA